MILILFYLLKFLCIFLFLSSPCNSLGLWKDVLVAGYGSGHLRVFSASTGKLAAEATAHARTINAIDIATDNGLVS